MEQDVGEDEGGMAEINWTLKSFRVDELTDYYKNPRSLSEKQFKQLKVSLDKFGMIDKPIVNADSAHTVIGGHQRKHVLEAEGVKEVECWIPDRELSEKEVEELNIRLNKNTGSWDFDILANEFELDDLLDWGFEKAELDLDLWMPDPPEDVEPQIDKAEELREKWGVETGQMWQLGEHRLICGDCTDKAVVEKLMKDEIVKTLFTSPPYNMAGGLYQSYTDNLKSAKYIEFNLDVIKNWVPYLSGYLFWNISYNKNSRWEFIEILYSIIKNSGLRFLELIVWDKGHGLPIVSQDMLTRSYEDILLVANEDTVVQELELFSLFGTERKAYFNKKTLKGITNYWKIGTNKSQNDNLLACFPVGLPERGIIITTLRGDIVADPFLGSGTTLIACERLGRKCRAVEISPAYVAVAIQRWVDVTGGEPVLLQ